MRRLRLPYPFIKIASLLFFSFVLGTTSSGQATPALVCFNVNAPLDDYPSCQAFLTAEETFGVAEGTLVITVDGTVRTDNILVPADVGKYIKYELTDANGRSCWALINLEEKKPPVIECPVDIVIACTQDPTDTSVTGEAEANDCSGIESITSSDQTRMLDCTDNALNFDGENDYVEMEDFQLGTGDFTFEFWINPETSNHSYIVTNRTTETAFPGNWFTIELSNPTGLPNQLSLWMGDNGGSGGASIFSNAALVLNQWTHVAVQRSGTDISFYIDGALDKTQNLVTVRSLSPANNTARLGSWVNQNSAWFDGSLDDLRLWKSARTASDIAANYDKTLNGNETDLANYYTFDNGLAGGTNTGIIQLEDNAGSLDGTLNTFALTGTSSNWVDNRFEGSKYSEIITRTFVATDKRGLKKQCSQTIRTERADIDQVVFPPDFIESCVDGTSTDPDVTGYPSITSAGIKLDIKPGEQPGRCMLQSQKSDLVIETCGTDSYIKRSWIVIIMCQTGGRPNVMRMADQIIKITSPGPVIAPINAIVLNANSGQAGAYKTCTSSEPLPIATAVSQCDSYPVPSENITISIIDNNGDVVGGSTNGGPAPNLTKGIAYTARYMAVDTCGRIGTLDVPVTVIDNEAPQCITQSDKFVPLQSNNQALIPALAFDGGSFDKCSPTVFIQGRRLTDDCSSTANVFGEYVEFCCSDIPEGVENTVMVQLLVCDLNPDLPESYIGDKVVKSSIGVPNPSLFKGRCDSTCMSTAIVKPNAPAEVDCPADMELSCAEFNDPDADFGSPNIISTCGMNSLNTTFTDDTTITCSLVLITRSHFNDSGSLICTQELTIDDPLLMIDDPANVTIEDNISCTDYDCDNRPDPEITGSPTLVGTSCIRQTPKFEFTDSEECAITDDRLSFTRTWTVDPATDTLNCYSDYNYIQKIITRDNCCNPITTGIAVQVDTVRIFVEASANLSNYNIEWFRDNILLVGRSFDTLIVSGTGAFKSEITQLDNESCRVEVQGPVSKNQRIIGFVSSEFGTPIQNVRVALESNQAARVIGKEEIMSEVMTDEVGNFEFEEIDLPSLNKMTLVKDGDDRDNISTRDLLIMARHILGIKEISSPYTYIAADLTGNGKITTSDMLLMQKIVLGITDDMPNNTSWRFVKEDYVFDDMNTILDYTFPENFIFTGEETEEDLKDLNFIAIKIGDLAGAYGAELRGGNSTEKTLSLQTDNQRLLPGAIIEVPIKAGDTRNLSGYQHAYKFDTDKVVFTGIDFGQELKLGDNNFGYQHLSDGYLTTSWYDTEDKNIEAGTVLYTLRFEVRAAAQLQDVLSISSQYTQAEAYFDEDKVGAVQFSFSKAIGEQLIVVSSPNPFKESTLVRFEAPKSGDVIIRVTDISGREVYRLEQAAVRGENQLTINKSDLQNAGIYILKIDLNGTSATQKIIMFE